MSQVITSPTLAVQSAIQFKRKQQIDSLKVFNADVREVQPGVEYQVGFHNVYLQQNFIAKIHLPPEFPVHQPYIWVSPTISHCWVENGGRIMAPGLVNYSEHSELGQIVHSIIRELKKAPPEKINGLTSHNSEPLKMKTVVSSQYNQYFPMPPFIPELESLSLPELENLNRNEDLLNQFVEELPQAASVSEDVDNLVASIQQLSGSIGEKKVQLNKQREGLVENYRSLNLLKQQWDSLSAQHQTLSQQYLPSNIEASLQKAATLAEEESEEIAETFLSGNMDVDKFINSYTASRTASHMRKTKEEILHKQLQELQRLGY